MSERSAAAPKVVSAKRTMIVLSVLGVAMLVSYRLGVGSTTVRGIVWFLKIVAIQMPVYLAAAWFSLRSNDSRHVLILGLAFAALFRLSIIFSPPYLSDDIYRYIWDGRVQAAGINPYRYIPADEALTGLRDEKIYPNINRRDHAHTMYPPVAEFIYLLTTRINESVTWMKATMVVFEAVAVWAIIQLLVSFGFARQRVLIYAWHPLAVWEFAGSGHVDAIAIAFIALAFLARRRNAEVTTGVMLACATLVKFFPAVLFPALFKRWNWKMPFAFAASLVLAYLPYLSIGPARVLGFLPGYASERGMLSGEQFFLLTVVRQLFQINVPTIAYFIFVLLVLAALSVSLDVCRGGPLWPPLALRTRIKGWSRRTTPTNNLRNGLIIACVFMVLLAPHFSWYFIWIIPFLCFIPSVPVFYLTFASFLLYLTWLDDTPNRVLMLKALIFVPFVSLALLAVWYRRRINLRLTS